MDSLAQRAIEEALKGNWKEAEDLNRQILKEDPNNREALNRLARASLELGKIATCKTCYKKVLRIDPYNSIAQKALRRLEFVETSGKNGNGSKPQTLSPILTANLFIEEPGKTKTVALIHLGDNSIVSILDSGEHVKLVPHAHRVSVESSQGNYIGRLPDDLSRRIIMLVRAGNKYSTVIKSVAPDNVKVFIRETERDPKLLNYPSFPQTEKTTYVAFTPPDSIHEERPDVSTTEEDF